MNKSVLVGVLGPKGSYTEQAALAYFNECSIVDDYLSPQDVIEDVAKLMLDYGVVPVENSIQGTVRITLDSLIKSRVNVIGEIDLPIHHVLACHPKADSFKVVYSHDQAYNQTREYLRAEYPQCVFEPTASTSLAARKVIEEGLEDALVICSEHAANTYGLKILSKDIALTNNNETRFYVIGNKLTNPTGNDKTTIAFGLADKAGALLEVLKVFGPDNYNINLSKIESKPTGKGLGDYIFIVDFEGHKDDDNVLAALKALGDHTKFIKILGSYPKSKNLNNKNGVEFSNGL